MKIYVVGNSKNRFLPLDNIREKFLIDQKHEGDNIDFLNPWYCELTALYYLWKHVDDDIVGLEHYRRYFWYNNHLLDENTIKNTLQEHDIICIRNGYSYQRPPRTWLEKNGKWNDMQKFLIFIKKYVGENYYNACIAHLNSNWHALGNMFIAKKSVADEYCEFIFDLLFKYTEAEKYFSRPIPYRIMGYFTEFLLGAWIIFNNKKYSFHGLNFIRR